MLYFSVVLFFVVLFLLYIKELNITYMRTYLLFTFYYKYIYLLSFLFLIRWSQNKQDKFVLLFKTELLSELKEVSVSRVYCTHLGDSISGTWRKLLLFWRAGVGESSVGAGRDSSSATGTWGDPNPVWMPYSISWNTLEVIGKNYYIL